MSDGSDLSAPIDALVRAVGGNPTEDDERASTFARGLALGALVGAAIAGSAIWQRRHAAPRSAPARTDGASPPTAEASGEPAN
jgi:hypothetical protein